MKLLILTTLFCLFNPILGFTQERIAILNLKNDAGLKEPEIAFLSDLIREDFSKNKLKNLQIMTKENINALLEKPLEACVSESECEVTLGRNLQAQFLVTGQILKIEQKYRFFMRIYDVKSANLIRSESGKASNIDELEQGLHQGSIQLIKSLSQEPIEETESKTQAKNPEETDNNQNQIIESKIELIGDTIGITEAQTLSNDIKQGFGIKEKYAVMILNIQSNSEAYLAGLKVEDILLMNNTANINELNQKLKDLPFYQNMQITYLRNIDGELKKFNVNFYKRPYLLGYRRNNNNNFYQNDIRKDLPLYQFLTTKYKMKDIYNVEILTINQSRPNFYCENQNDIAWKAHQDRKWFIRLTVYLSGSDKSESHFVNLLASPYYIWDRYACANLLY
jgi:hypothetical protein